MMTLVCDGQTFSLNRQRVRQQAPKSRFASLAAELSQTNTTTTTMYVDRDADVVALLVSFLRSGVLPTRMTKYDRRRLLAEARYWRVDGVEDVLNRKKAVRNHNVGKKKFVDNDDDDDNDDNDDDKDDDNSDESNGAKKQDLASDVDEENEDELSDSEEAVDEELSELAVRLFACLCVCVCVFVV
jgi:hypothetical protein